MATARGRIGMGPRGRKPAAMLVKRGAPVKSAWTAGGVFARPRSAPPGASEVAVALAHQHVLAAGGGARPDHAPGHPRERGGAAVPGQPRRAAPAGGGELAAWP